MSIDELVFEGSDKFEVTGIDKCRDKVQIEVVSKQYGSKCPGCQVLSKTVHSYYRRTVMDLPIIGHKAWICLKARKFRCLNECCERKVFAERFSEHFKSSKRVTTRMENRLLEIAQQLGGNGGERICRQLNMPTSSSTLIRSIHRCPVKAIPSPRVLGIDDWAYTKRINYGTILVDLERRKVIDLLPDREAESIEKWLKDHPGVEIITRDRFANFANGVRRASDSIINVADRWHLLYNLTEVLKKMLTRNNHYLKETREDEIVKEMDKDILAQEADKKAQFQARSIYHKKFIEVKRMLAMGYTVVRITRELAIDRRTVYKWKKLDEVPRRKKREQTNIVMFEEQVRKILSERPGTSIFTIWQTIRQQGYTGSQVTAYKQIGRIKGKKHKYLPTQASAFWQPGKISLLMCKSPDKLTAKEKEMIACLSSRSNEIKQAVILANGFRTMMDQKNGVLLNTWIERTISSDIKELSGFARGMLGDFNAVQNALSMQWSNGQVEGQVNKLKTIKRQMYGRASFSLLKKRLIYESVF